jgi:hypothetical protein
MHLFVAGERLAGKNTADAEVVAASQARYEKMSPTPIFRSLCIAV